MPWGEGHRVFADPTLSVEDLYVFAEDWFGVPPNQVYYGLYVWHEPLVKVKGGPVDPEGADVRTGPAPKTLRRWQHNRRLQRVALAQYPRLSPGAAVEKWWRKGGSMQPLRWSDDQVAQLEHDTELQRVAEEGASHDPGDTLFVVGGTKVTLASPAVVEKERAKARERYQRDQAAKAARAGQVYRYKPRKRT